MIDILYESHARVVCSAAVPLADLYVPETVAPVPAKHGKPSSAISGEEENFAFDRTVSRLLEMQSVTYLDKHKELILQRQLSHSHL